MNISAPNSQAFRLAFGLTPLVLQVLRPLSLNWNCTTSFPSGLPFADNRLWNSFASTVTLNKSLIIRLFLYILLVIPKVWFLWRTLTNTVLCSQVGPEYLLYIDNLWVNGGFLDSSVGKESACNTGDPGSTPGSGRSSEEGINYPFLYSWASLMA